MHNHFIEHHFITRFVVPDAGALVRLHGGVGTCCDLEQHFEFE
jgi:hypothetical protein